MRLDYSKPLGDIAVEEASRAQDERLLCERQMATVAGLAARPRREMCLLCANPLEGLEFLHRTVPFIECHHCGHIQTKVLPPPNYPHVGPNAVTFSEVYPRLHEDDYRRRKKRIYQPKLDWALQCFSELSLSPAKLQDLAWAELGCGAGYFVSCVRDFGVKACKGIDADAALVDVARERVGENLFELYEGPLSGALERFPANVYVAFFVLEHLEDAHAFYSAFSRLPAGTFLLFSVPVFSFATLLDGVFSNSYARHLDAVVHTQIYTERSIESAMLRAGCKIMAQWIFGQDAADLRRLLIANLRQNYPERLLDRVDQRLRSLLDPLQQSLDRLEFSDQRHVLAVRQ